MNISVRIVVKSTTSLFDLAWLRSNWNAPDVEAVGQKRPFRSLVCEVVVVKPFQLRLATQQLAVRLAEVFDKETVSLQQHDTHVWIS